MKNLHESHKSHQQRQQLKNKKERNMGTDEPEVVVDPVTGEPSAEEGTPLPDTTPPGEEGNDQAAGEGTEAPEVSENQVNDAPDNDQEGDGA
jgi:hypothetical protein